jgi:hypothetical protein
MEADGHAGLGLDGFTIQVMMRVAPQPDRLNGGHGQDTIAIQYSNFFHPAIGCDHDVHADFASEMGVGSVGNYHMALRRFRHLQSI